MEKKIIKIKTMSEMLTFWLENFNDEYLEYEEDGVAKRLSRARITQLRDNMLRLDLHQDVANLISALGNIRRGLAFRKRNDQALEEASKALNEYARHVGLLNLSTKEITNTET